MPSIFNFDVQHSALQTEINKYFWADEEQSAYLYDDEQSSWTLVRVK